MTEARWQTVKRIFQEAVDQGHDGRAEFLECACAGDPVLLGEVQALLAVDLESSSPVGTAAIVRGIERAIDRVDLESHCLPGTRVGPYRILSEIGHGGMGVVYRAERADNTYRRDVAIKILRSRLDNHASADRFRRERHTLAR